MASQDPGDNRDNKQGPRMPKDMKGLLRLCAETADSNDPNETTEFQAMNPERREWLEKALDDMSVSPVGEMKKGIAVIIDENRDVDDRIQALESIVEWCDHIDFAVDFHKIGGFVIFPVCLNNEEPELRWQCLDLIGTMVQNNPYCQQAVLENGLLPTMLQILDKDTDATVRTKALYAVSCLTRDNQEALDMFIQHDGFSYIMRAMQADVEKLKIKSAFMLSSICTDNDQCKDILCDIGMIDQLVGHLSEEHSSFHEHVMSALLTIIRNHPRSVQECLRPEVNFVSVLQHRQQELKGKDEYREEYEYAEELLELVKPTTPVTEEDQDVAR